MSRRTVGRKSITAEALVQTTKSWSSANSASENEDGNDSEKYVPIYAGESKTSCKFEMKQKGNLYNISFSNCGIYENST